jgi:uncharacterized membrane protein YidH (DUF202 family)
MGSKLAGLLVFILGGLLFAVGIVGFVATTLSPPIMELWGKLGHLSVSMFPAIALVVVFFILFLAGVYLMKVALSRQNSP